MPAARVTTPEFPLLSPASYGRSAQFQQTLFLAHGKEEHGFQCAVEIHPDKLYVRAYSALGQRLFGVEHDGLNLKTEVTPLGPKNIPAKAIVNDLQFAFWPLDAIQSTTKGTVWQISEPRPGLRRLYLGERLYAEMHEGIPASNARRLWISNLVYGYTLDITSEAVDGRH